MKIFPAVDILNGRAVRLVKGDYGAVTEYGDPLDRAKSFKSQGSDVLHTVDLEGARSGVPSARGIIEKIVKETGLFVQTGGGIRRIDTVRAYAEIGVSRIILGTAALCDNDLLDRALDIYGSRIAVSVDIKNGYVSTAGWLDTSDVHYTDFMALLEKKDVSTVICTDISRDGKMQGTNLELYKSLKNNFRIDFIASGGVSSLEDIKALSEIGVYGVIVGKALYEGRLDLKTIYGVL